jgi:hypothetical protein
MNKQKSSLFPTILLAIEIVIISAGCLFISYVVAASPGIASALTGNNNSRQENQVSLSNTPTVLPTCPPVPTITPKFTPTSTPIISETLLITTTLEPTPTEVVIPCNYAEFVADVTIPDDTVIRAGKAFKKTWSIRNIGTCVWTPEYALVFSNGDNLRSPQEVYFPNAVLPGESIDLTVTLVAPLYPDCYQANFLLRDGIGNLFGVGYNSSEYLWAAIISEIPGIKTKSC